MIRSRSPIRFGYYTATASYSGLSLNVVIHLTYPAAVASEKFNVDLSCVTFTSIPHVDIAIFFCIYLFYFYVWLYSA